MPYPLIDPVAFAFGPFAVHWYGLAYLAGIAGAWWLALLRAGAGNGAVIRRGEVEDAIFYPALGLVLGGRLGYVLFYGLEHFLQDPLWALRIWEGGMAFHGGLLGAAGGAWLCARKLRVDAARLMEFLAPLAPLGLGFGRLGNFIGQELWGRPATVPWAMVFPNDPLQLPRHPSQLYQAALEGFLLFIILYWFSSRPRPRFAVGGAFLAGYGALRFFAEFFREPDAHIGFDLFGWMTRGQLLCLPMLALGAFFLCYAYRQASK